MRWGRRRRGCFQYSRLLRPKIRETELWVSLPTEAARTTMSRTWLRPGRERGWTVHRRSLRLRERDTERWLVKDLYSVFSRPRNDADRQAGELPPPDGGAPDMGGDVEDLLLDR
jgi:hypothetical protein